MNLICFTLTETHTSFWLQPCLRICERLLNFRYPRFERLALRLAAWLIGHSMKAKFRAFSVPAREMIRDGAQPQNESEVKT